MNAATEETPLVSVIVPAFNLARYLPAALDSALAQRDPGGPVEIIVVDDGSTDDTAQVLAGYVGRVEILRHVNSGLVASVERALAQVRGRYVALLDADDEWPPERLARHVAILDARPEVGLVHGDMELIDAHGNLMHRSFIERQGLRPVDGRALGPLMANNFVSGGASTFRRSLLPAIIPFEPAVVYPDWRIAVGVACVSEVAYDSVVANRYRRHDANMGLDADAARRAEILRSELPWRRWMLREFSSEPSVTVAHLASALQAWRHALLTAAVGTGQSVAALAEPAHPARPEAGRESARELVEVFAADPLNGMLALEVEVALMREIHEPSRPLPPAPAAVVTHANLTLAWLDEVVRFPGLLEAYASGSIESGRDSLVVLTAPGDDLSPLIALAAGSSALSDERCDIQVIEEPVSAPARAWLRARASAQLTLTVEGATRDVCHGLPRHPSADQLRVASV
ncbi:MAG TPA: glycosyltransferase [Solirubrobacteraceae bacterium]|nr:glycosyltransferase [Solirubrobacteraceae bacterium]